MDQSNKAKGQRLEQQVAAFFAAHGYYNPLAKHIGLQEGSEIDHAAKTIIHETTHYLANHRGYQNRDDAETVAESTAYVVSHHFGLDTSAYSFGYVANWAQDAAVFKRNVHQIQQLSTTIISAVEGKEASG